MMSKRRLVLPSFNDVRTILNTAQILALLNIYRTSHGSRLKLITFDGDVTLYNDGASLTVDSPIVYKLVELLKLDLFVGVVTAAGYPGQSGADQYYERLRGLIDVLRSSTELTDSQKANLLVMGGESNYLFRYDNSIGTFRFIEGDEWYLPMMKNWDKSSIETIMESSYQHIRYLQKQFNLAGKTSIIRKKRSIGIVPNSGEKILREQLEEMVLSCSINVNSVLEKLGQKNDGTDIRVCAFNGGSDVWVDIGDKSLGVESLQRYLCKEVDHEYCPILKSESLHIGDQFASLGANDFKARLSACTVWIANPKETDAILEDLISQVSTKK